MKKFTLAIVTLAVTFFITKDASARVFRRKSSNRSYTSYGSYTSYNTVGDTSTAQGVAEIMARSNRVGHWGGHSPYYEGCGSGFSQDQAYRNCCYSNSGLKTIDVGYAQANNGMWYCCRRYSR